MSPLITFELFGIKLQVWGVFFALGTILSFLLFIALAKKEKISLDLAYNLYFLSFFSALIGGRIFYFLVHPQYFSWPAFFSYFEGGYILFGALLFSFLMAVFYLYLQKQKITAVLEILILPALVALVFMRFGSWLTQDNIGKITNLPWAIDFLGEKRHPIDLYFIFLDLYLIAFFFWLKYWRQKAFFWIVLFMAIGRLIIHHFMTFTTLWDANCDILFWSLALVLSLAGLGNEFSFLDKKYKKA